MKKTVATIIVQPKTTSSLALSEICHKVNVEVTEICNCTLRAGFLLQKTCPNLVIIDANKDETIHLLQSTPHQIRKIVLSRYKEEDYLLNLIRSNATSICLKEQKNTEIALAINTAKEGKSYLAPEVTEILIKAYKKETAKAKIKGSLSEREIQILAFLVEGYHNQEIADFLHLKQTTVKSYIEKIITKLNCRNRTHVAATAMSLRLL